MSFWPLSCLPVPCQSVSWPPVLCQSLVSRFSPLSPLHLCCADALGPQAGPTFVETTRSWQERERSECPQPLVSLARVAEPNRDSAARKSWSSIEAEAGNASASMTGCGG